MSLARSPTIPEFRKKVWVWVLALLAFGSALGSVAHGFDLSDATRTMMWRPLYLSLGLTVALFFVGGLRDLRGDRAAKTALPWAIAAGVAFFAVTQMSDGSFLVFIVYEAVAVVATLGIYVYLWTARRLAGAGLLTLGVALTLAAAVVQVSTLHARIVWPFDHNGLFHLVQMAAVLVIARGLRAVNPEVRPAS